MVTSLNTFKNLDCFAFMNENVERYESATEDEVGFKTHYKLKDGGEGRELSVTAYEKELAENYEIKDVVWLFVDNEYGQNFDVYYRCNEKTICLQCLARRKSEFCYDIHNAQFIAGFGWEYIEWSQCLQNEMIKVIKRQVVEFLETRKESRLKTLFEEITFHIYNTGG